MVSGQKIQWFKNGDHPDDGPKDKEGKVVRYFRHPAISGETVCPLCRNTMHVHGWIDSSAFGGIVCPGDFVETMADGEYKVARRKSIYLASPYGFSPELKKLLVPIIEKLESLGLEVWEPFARNNQQKFAHAGWAYEIGQADISDVKNADAIFAVVNGTPPDEGVMVELGGAIVLGKPTFLFRDDFRRCSDCEQYPLNLMLFTGLPESGWEDSYYTSVDEITDPSKALAKWAVQ